MGQPLGKRQIEIAELILKQRLPLDAVSLAKLIYKKQPTKTILNIVWGALSGMEKRGMVRTVGKTTSGHRRWELTKQGREDLRMLKSQTNVHQLSV